MRFFKDLEMAIFYNDETTKIKINEQWFGEQIRKRPVVDEHGDPLIISMNFMGIPVEFSEDVEDFELIVET
ncbi:hypothetical protein SAMN05192559_104110 [Halobacillus karajensis]|uniref:hypothetical protein n=1 Tax=Halobacillus karajensis TaxID=195088 RepID=UPI0008A7EB97|nr:hypothetical protein [Halobacillus karajensis]SEH78641.1 hypothetical protein SAMN05192559_104110 [Halobacillus karajensis]